MASLAATATVVQSAALAALPNAAFDPGTGLATSLKCRVAAAGGAVKVGLATVAPVSVTAAAPVTAVSEPAPSTWVHRQVTLSPQGPVAVPESVTVAPVDTDCSPPASAAGLNGAPGLLCSHRSSSAVRFLKTFSGSVPRLLLYRDSIVSAVRSSKTFAGSVARALWSRRSSVSPLSPSKSPACRLASPLFMTFRVPAMPARRAGVRSAQSVTPVLATMASRTAGVRLHTSVAATLMSKMSDTVPPWLSFAVTLTDSVPASPAAGVPEKVRAVAARVSHAGRSVPSDRAAV